VNITREPHTPSEVIALADPVILDGMWAMSGDRIPPGVDDDGRVAKAREFIESTDTMHAPCVAFDVDKGVIIIRFIQGRHRFAVMRDFGWKQVPIAMPTSCVRYARQIGLIVETQAN
jgi:hypothetical protein